VIYGLISVNFGGFAAWHILPNDVMSKHFAYCPNDITSPAKWYKLLTATLSTPDLMTLGINSLVLVGLGEFAIQSAFRGSAKRLDD